MDELLQDPQALNSHSAARELAQALTSRGRVSGHTHHFYRYPARFSPEFVRMAISLFSQPGDLVMDPFVGGGTTAVEALAQGRRILAGDINPLAVFVTRAKTTLLTEGEAREVMAWADGLSGRRAVDSPSAGATEKVDGRLPWWLKGTIRRGMRSLEELPSLRVRRLARATLLRAGQWALDGRRELPRSREFLAKHREMAAAMCGSSVRFGEQVMASFGVTARREAERNRLVFCSPADALAERNAALSGPREPALVLTSPPYHGVHILYHRWQVRGRKETNAPYWMTGLRDGRPASHYTFGPRVRASHEQRSEYFERALAAYRGVAKLCLPQTLVVQLVGFSQPQYQLPAYRSMMEQAGFVQVDSEGAVASLCKLRSVPNRKWYLDALNRTTHASTEFMLVHRLR